MRRVHTIHVLRAMTPMVGAALMLLLVALWGIGREVWVAQVFVNMPSLLDLEAFARFIVVAFVHTDLLVQVLAVLALGATVWLAHSIGRVLERTARFV